MATWQIVCSGPHPAGPVTLGTVNLPDDQVPQAAITGYLCEQCGAIYTAAVGALGYPAGTIPDQQLVDKVLPMLDAPSA